MESEKDERLWRIARNRAAFKKNVYSYIIMNCFFWAIWWFTQGHASDYNGIPWPIWATLGWGLGLAMQYFKAYNGDKDDLTQQEYERLKREKGL